MAGGGNPYPRPGEISLAHHGVLFLDELPEFHKDVIEVLRQPMEEGVISVVRSAASETYPCDFTLLCAMNPCKCGWYGHPSGRCRCTPAQVKRYLGKLSGPLLDRIDLFAEVPPWSLKPFPTAARGILRRHPRPGHPGPRPAERPLRPRWPHLQRRHGPGGPAPLVRPGPRGQALMKGAYEHMGLTARSYDRILRVARTIADLDGAAAILAHHLAEAIQYRESDYFAS